MNRLRNKLASLVSLLRRKEIIPILTPVVDSELFKGKSALVSGGTGGIGKAIARVLLDGGCSVAVSGNTQSKIDATLEELSSNRVFGFVMDLRDVGSFDAVVDSACNLCDGKCFDILVNAAGVNDPTRFLNVTEKTYDTIMAINAKGTYFLSQVVARKMIENGVHGHILNVSSASALRPAAAPYAISKWAVVGMTKGIADELIEYGIVVNAIAPGPVATPMLNKNVGDEISHPTSPAGRYATPSEIANLAAFMVSDYGDLIVGDTFYISGGSGVISLHT